MTKRSIALLATLLLSTFTLATAQAPSGSTGQCKDGTYTSTASKSGACRGHKGIQTWYATSAATPAATPAKAAKATKATAAAPAAAPAVAPAPAPKSAPAQKSAPAPMMMTQAAGGGNGQVWVNTSTKVYHCSGDRYYGKTKQGAYMTEAAAKAQGDKPDAGKPCSK